MMLDVDLSAELNTEYRTHQQTSSAKRAIDDLSISVLTGGTWPNMDDKAARLPPAMQTSMERFTAWYTNKNPNRQLTWSFTNGSAEMQTSYTQKKRYTFVVNCYQAAILGLFNQDDTLTCAKIKDLAQVPADAFKDAMMQLCNPKIMVLKKEIKKPIFKDDEKITLNMTYKSNSIRVNLVPKKSTKKQSSELTDEERKQKARIDKERTFVVQAHIVKVMKTQKQYRF